MGISIAMAAAVAAVVAPAFRPVEVRLDLSHRTSVPAIVSGGEIVPSTRWPEIMDLYDQQGSLTVQVPLPVADLYLWRMKLACQESGQRVTVLVNGTPCGVFTAAKGQDQAEKFQFKTLPQLVRDGVGLVEFRHAGPPRSVRYELVSARNYRSALIPRAVYLVSREGRAARLGLLAMLAWTLIGAGWILGCSFLGGRAVAWTYLGRPGRSGWWCRFPWPLVAIVALAGHLVAEVTEYRLILSPVAGAVLLAGLVTVPYVVTAVPALLWRALRLILRALIGRELLVRTAVAMALRIVGRAIAKGAVLLVARGLPAAARAMWRWWCRHQNAEGYLRFFVYLLVVAGLLWWLTPAKAFADRVGEWAWCALLISCLGYAWRALRAERLDP